jgi:hypothetical protein
VGWRLTVGNWEPNTIVVVVESFASHYPLSFSNNYVANEMLII